VQYKIEWFQQCLANAGLNNPLTFQLSQNLDLFNFSGQGLNNPIVVDVHHWFVAGWTFEEMLKSLLEGESFAAWRLAGVEYVAFLVLKPGFQFF
jgi:hypothetical protein